MKILCTADWHFRGKDLEAATAQLRELIRIAEEEKVDYAIVAGDIFEGSNIYDVHETTGGIVKAILPFIHDAPFARLHWVMIPGNHDLAGIGSTDALTVFSECQNVRVVRTPGLVYCGNVAVACLPWSWSGDDPEEAIRELAASDEVQQAPVSILAAHIQVAGAKMNTKRVHEGGSWTMSREALASFDFNHFALGDFHERQDLTDGRGGYVGAFRQLNFGEEGNPAGFEIFDTETLKTQWFDLTEAPTYRTVEVREGEPLPERRENEKLKVRTIGWSPPRDIVAKAEAAGVIYENILPYEERVARVEEIPEGIIDQPIEVLRLWAKSQEPPIEEERMAALEGELSGILARGKSAELVGAAE